MAQLRGETVRQWGEEAQDLAIPADRAQQIAAAVGPLAAVARSAERNLPFDCEPSAFVVAQRRWAEPKP